MSSSVPRSTIYRSEAPTLVQRTTSFHVKGEQQKLHMFLIFKSGANYTQEQIDKCDGVYRCLNCSRKIEGAIFFYPLYRTKTKVPVFHPAPHCRLSCALRTVINIPNNFDLMSNWTLVYGPCVIPAPDRMLLYLPGGMTLDQYHAQVDECTIYEIEKSDAVRSFLAPVYVSAVLLDKHHLLLSESAAEIENMHLKSETPLHVPDANSNQHADVRIVNVPVRNPLSSSLAKVFSVDSASARIQH